MATSPSSSRKRMSFIEDDDGASTSNGVDELVKELGDTDITNKSQQHTNSTSPSQSSFIDSKSTEYSATSLRSLGYYKYKNESYSYNKESHSKSSSLDSIDNIRTIWAAGLERRRRAVCFSGMDGQQQEQPPTKRRRFQRRNSKTPQMILKAMSFLSDDLSCTREGRGKTTAAATTATMSSSSDKDKDKEKAAVIGNSTQATQKQDNREGEDDCWSDGLEIAEQILQQIHKRRMSEGSTTN